MGLLGRCRPTGDDSIDMLYLGEISFEVLKWIQMARDAVKILDFVNTKINSQVYVKVGEFRDPLRECQLYVVFLAVTLFSRLINILGMFVNSNFVTVTAYV